MVIQFDFPERVTIINADPSQVRQVIMNLIINASEAIGDGPGEITISAGTKFCDRLYLHTATHNDELPEGEYAFLEVRDTGCGMDRETLERIFEPFFTTKFTGRGLGLAAVIGIVRGHRGSIKISSEPGRGTTFQVLFPASQQEADINSPPAESSGELHGTGTVLLVDDEESVLSVGTRMLEQLGFTVITASNGREAVTVFRDNMFAISCVILDLTMPQMNGVETFKELHRIRPNTRVLISSGYSEYEISERFSGYSVAGFILKPYRFSDLVGKLKGLME